MKKLFAVILTLLTLCACSAGGSEEISDTQITDTDAAVMTAEAISNKEIHVLLSNESNWVVGYGQPYWIEVEKDGKWHILEPKEEALFTMELMILEAGQSSSWSTDVSFIYGELPEGKYRIVKNISIYKDANDFQSGEDMTLAAEFKI